MKISIVGAGNMGGAIACGLVGGNHSLTVIDHSGKNVARLHSFSSAMNVVVGDYTSLSDADIIILAVKPWLIESVLKEHKELLRNDKQILISVAAGISLSQLKEWAGLQKTVCRVMPNTAIACSQSMTFVAMENQSKEQQKAVLDIFSQLGKVELIEEKLFPAATSLASCGIAFAFRYIRAAMGGGVEMGLYPDQSRKAILQTLRGAIELLEANGSHPEAEIDKVTTPGGITVKGLNEMEHAGFTSAVIRGLKASNVK